MRHLNFNNCAVMYSLTLKFRKVARRQFRRKLVLLIFQLSPQFIPEFRGERIIMALLVGRQGGHPTCKNPAHQQSSPQNFSTGWRAITWSKQAGYRQTSNVTATVAVVARSLPLCQSYRRNKCGTMLLIHGVDACIRYWLSGFVTRNLQIRPEIDRPVKHNDRGRMLPAVSAPPPARSSRCF